MYLIEIIVTYVPIRIWNMRSLRLLNILANCYATRSVLHGLFTCQTRTKTKSQKKGLSRRLLELLRKNNNFIALPNKYAEFIMAQSV